MEQESKSKSPMSSVLDRIERWGNRLPHPFNLFLLFALAFCCFPGSLMLWDLRLLIR